MLSPGLIPHYCSSSLHTIRWHCLSKTMMFCSMSPGRGLPSQVWTKVHSKIGEDTYLVSYLVCLGWVCADLNCIQKWQNQKELPICTVCAYWCSAAGFKCGLSSWRPEPLSETLNRNILWFQAGCITRPSCTQAETPGTPSQMEGLIEQSGVQ